MAESLLVAVVDDDEDVRLALHSLLYLSGFRVELFADAAALLASNRLHDFSCVISDIRMAGLSGLDLARELRRIGVGSGIILMTAFPTDGQQATAAQFNVHAVLAKPFEVDLFVSCVKSAARPRT